LKQSLVALAHYLPNVTCGTPKIVWYRRGTVAAHVVIAAWASD